MATPLDAAIAVLEEEIASFQQGTKDQPKEKTTDWFLLRAKSLGLSSLKTMAARQLADDPVGAERFHCNASKYRKAAFEPS